MHQPLPCASNKSAGECETEIPGDDALEEEVGAGLEQVQQVLVLKSEVVQVVQQVIHQRGAVHCVQARFVEGVQTRVHSQVGKVDEGVQDQVLQEFVVVATAFKTIRGLIY